MPWDRKSLLGHVETIQLILGVTDKFKYITVSAFRIYAPMVKTPLKGRLKALH